MVARIPPRPALRSVLLASEHLHGRQLARLALATLGQLRVSAARLGDPACAASLAETPDLVLLDAHQQTAAARLTLARLLRQRPAGALRVVVLADSNADADAPDWRALGADGVLEGTLAPLRLPGQLRALWDDLAPAVPAAPAVVALAAAPPPAAASARRVLVVDDEPLQRRVLAAALRHCGVADVVEAGSGAAALALLAQPGHAFDLLISDLQMDGMNGLELVSAARSHRVPALALTSALEPVLLDAAAAALRAQGLPVVGLLEKPIALTALRTLLARLGQPAQAEAPAMGPLPWSRAELLAALEGGQFVPYFQPKVNLDTRRPCGLEVLVRWRHPKLGILAPAQFIDALERSGLLGRLAASLFAQALDVLPDPAGWGERFDVALNLSVRSLDDPGLPQQLLRIAQAGRVEPRRITLELTETAVARYPERLQAAVTQLRLQGFRVALDDFGTGYASLAQLCALPFTELKIDRSFVSGMVSDRKARPVLEAMLGLGTRLGLHTVAEGIETEEECRALQELGCQTGQGYLFARPMDGAALRRWRPAWA